jgi:hypothetical protein
MSLYWFDEVDFVITAAPPPPPLPEGRFLLAFDDPALAPNPTWTRIDSVPNLVTSYTIDRGRQYELDRTDASRATVQIIDPDGILDPTNPGGPYYGKLQPLLQATIGRRNPCTGAWTTRWRGFVEDYAYEIDPSQRLNRLTISLVDLFELLSTAEMHPGQFGTTPPVESQGQVYYPSTTFNHRIYSILGDLGVPHTFWEVFPGNIDLYETVYSPGESVLSALQETADAEFPGIANIHCDGIGRLICPDRHSRFAPEDISAEVGIGVWNFQEWGAGDGAAVAASGNTLAQLRTFSFSRSLSKIINSAAATPVGIHDVDVAGALFTDPASIAQYGVRSWSADNLLTGGTTDGTAGALFTCKQFAEFYVNNYGSAHNRITDVSFQTIAPGDPRAPALWAMVNGVDINHAITTTVSAPGGGGFNAEGWFIEGMHETCTPLTPDYDNVVLRLDLSPRAAYAVDPFTA